MRLCVSYKKRPHPLTMTTNSIKTLCIFLSIILYVGSLCLPAAVIPDFERGIAQTSYGYELLISGWLGLVSLQLAWLANPLYIIALFSYGSITSYRCGSAALLLSLLSPFILVNQLLIGFYIWVVSFIILLYGNNLHKF